MDDQILNTNPQIVTMTSQELEAHINDLGLLMIAAYSRYEASGCFSDRGEADRLRLEMERAISQRDVVHVAAMEAERELT